MCTMHDTPHVARHALLLIVSNILMGGMVRDQHVPPVVKYSEANAVVLHDALGRRLVLPLELCKTESVSAQFLYLYKSMYADSLF